ncbi:MAG TPA: DnaJ domain-containing protein [Candidatus Nitrosotenuis sp.]|nr:DnaJ domain-containing protein [Candidatus Nitrosotenuis sp.]
MEASQAYRTLNIEHDSSFDEIKYAYRKLALELHPDKNESERDGAKFRLITEAYHLLKNNNKVSNSKHRETDYSDKKVKKEQKVSRTHWGAGNERTPEEDWSRYTKETEQSDPGFWRSYVAEFWKNYESRTNQAKNQYDFDITREKKKDPDLFVDVDHSLCIACCSCETIAPQVFLVDKALRMNPKSNVINQKGAKMDKIMDAAQTCPTKAISIEEQRTGKRLYPY